jgi:hypothetical protein
MPPPTHIEGLDPRFFRPCVFPILRALNYGVRPTVNNGVGPDRPNATDLCVSFSLFDGRGTHLGTTGVIHELAPGEIAKFDVDELLARDDVAPHIAADEAVADQLGVLHLVPKELVGKATADVSTKDLMDHMLASDDFIEFVQDDGPVVTGVAYQTGPKNDKRFGSTLSTVVQAPKVIVSDTVDTLFTLLNISTTFDYSSPVDLDFWILGPGGDRVTRSSVRVPAWSFRMISATDVLEQAGVLDDFRAAGGMGMLLGYSKNGTVVPLSLTRNRRSGAIACDHTLPPVFYISSWGGQKRLEANARLEEEFFSAPLPAGTAAR